MTRRSRLGRHRDRNTRQPATLEGVQDARKETSLKSRPVWRRRVGDAARLVVIVAVVLALPMALQVLRRQAPAGVLLVVIGIAAGALAVAALAGRR